MTYNTDIKYAKDSFPLEITQKNFTTLRNFISMVTEHSNRLYPETIGEAGEGMGNDKYYVNSSRYYQNVE